MKKQIYIIIFLIVLLTNCIPLMSQNMGRIEVNNDYTATLVFSEEVEFIIVGNNPQIGENKFKFYDIFQSGRTAVIRGNDTNAPSTSITVKLLDGQVWYGELIFGTQTKVLYDFTRQENVFAGAASAEKKQEQEAKNIEDKKVQDNESRMKERLNSLLSEKPEYLIYGVRENGMEFQISNIRNDEKYSYFKIIVSNKTGGEYNVDGIFFKYVEGKRKGVSKKEAKIEERIFPVYESPVKVIKAYSTEELGFVIPLFSVGDKGNLQIQMREASGTRNPLIDIEGTDMLNVKIFKNNL